MHLRPRLLASPVFLALTLSIASPAAADDDLQRARALFDEAGDLEKQGQWTAAQERLRAAIRIRETPHLHYALGWALENDDKLDEAMAEYEVAKRLAAAAGNADVERLAESRIEVLDRRKKAPTDVHVAVAAKAQEDTRSRTLPLVLVAGGGVTAISAIALLVSSAGDVSSRDTNMQRWCDLTACQGTNATRPETEDATLARREAIDASSRGNTKQVAGAILGTVGLVGIAVGTYMLLDSGRRKEGRVSVDASALPGGAFGSATLAF